MKEKIYNLSDHFQENLFLIGLCLLIVASGAAVHNITIPDEPQQVGYTEVSTECQGINLGVCLGLQTQTYETYNYDNYEKPEEGTENYYRRVEAELMVRAYNTCSPDMEGYEWTDDVSYEGKTASEWRQNENIELLPCEKTFFRKLEE